ncbi:MAG: hypothetical protein JNL34_01890 [Anaerolineae bacterium]|nr:hypothetical protein [Anaerolineae bacterium]
MFPIVLAHGALGDYDELLFVLIGIIFVGLMVFAWLRSRSGNTTPANAQGPAEPAQPGADEAATGTKSHHFPLA